mgnify:FL=1
MLEATWSGVRPAQEVVYRPARAQTYRGLEYLMKWAPTKDYPLSSMAALHKRLQEANYRKWFEEKTLQALSKDGPLTDGLSRELPFVPSNGWWYLFRVWPRAFRTVQPMHAWAITSILYSAS